MGKTSSLKVLVERVLAEDRDVIEELREMVRGRLKAVIDSRLPGPFRDDPGVERVLEDAEHELPKALRHFEPEDGRDHDAAFDEWLIGFGIGQVFGHVWRRYEHTVRGAIYRALPKQLRDRGEAEVVLQETSRVALRNFRRFEWRGEGATVRWLQRIAFRQTWDLMGRDRHTIPVVPNAPSHEGDSPRPDLIVEVAVDDMDFEELMLLAEKIRILHEAIASELTESEREAVRLHYFEFETLRETGRMMGVNRMTAWRQCRSARKKLRRVFRQFGFTCFSTRTSGSSEPA